MKLQKRINYRIEFISDKGVSKFNEDAVSINEKDRTFAVFDGATSLAKFTDPSGRSGAYLASNAAKRVFDKGANDLKSLVMEANVQIRNEMLNAGIDLSDKLNLWGTTVAAVKMRDSKFDWLQISDTNILVIYEQGGSEFLVNGSGQDVKALTRLKSLIDAGVQDPLGRIMPDLIAQRRRLNVEYGVIAGEADVKFIRTGSQSLKGVKAIIIFSDGMMIPHPDPSQEPSADLIAREYERGGLRGWLEHVRSMESADLDLRLYPRFKLHDDASAVAIKFE